MTIAGMTERLKTLDVYQIAFDILYTYQFELEAVQKSQLWAGRDLKGALLSPTLLDDPHFGLRPYGIANLIYTSDVIVWDNIRVFKSGKDLRIGTEFGLQMEKKYGDLFGLNLQGVEYILREFFREEFSAAVRKHLFGE